MNDSGKPGGMKRKACSNFGILDYNYLR